MWRRRAPCTFCLVTSTSRSGSSFELVLKIPGRQARLCTDGQKLANVTEYHVTVLPSESVVQCRHYTRWPLWASQGLPPARLCHIRPAVLQTAWQLFRMSTLCPP